MSSLKQSVGGTKLSSWKEYILCKCPFLFTFDSEYLWFELLVIFPTRVTYTYLMTGVRLALPPPHFLCLPFLSHPPFTSLQCFPGAGVPWVMKGYNDPFNHSEEWDMSMWTLVGDIHKRGGKMIPTRRHHETSIMAVEEMLGELSWRVLSMCELTGPAPL